MPRKEYQGGVSATTLAAGIDNAATSLVVATGDGADFPTGVTYDFVIVVGRGTSTEEVMLCTARSTDTFTVTRGYDGTTAVAHQAGETVEHCIDAGIIEALTVVMHTLTTQGDLPYATADATWARLAKGTARQQLAMNSGATAPEWVASMQSLLSTQGDIVYASAANTPARLALGTARQVLATNAGATAPEWVASLASLLTAKGSIVTASAANTPVALAAGSDFTHLRARAAAANGIEYAALGSAAKVETSETTTSTSYTDLATPGPAVTITTGTSAIVLLNAYIDNSAGAVSLMSFAVSGATTRSGDDDYTVRWLASGSGIQFGACLYVTGLTAGSNTFTCKYRVTGGTGTFDNRHITVIPL